MSYTKTGSQPLSPDACEISPELLAVQDLMPISAEDREALRESIKRDGIREPLRGYWGKDESGKRVFFVLSGFNRLEIAKELKLATVTVEAVETDDREAFAIDENRARRQLSLDDKRRLAAWILERHPEKSNRQIAEQAGIDDKTAGKIRQVLEGRSEIPNAGKVREALKGRAEIPHVEKRTDSKGRKQAAIKQKGTKNTPSDRTGDAQASSVKPGKGSGREEPESGSEAITEPINAELTGFPAVSAALAKLRHTIQKLTKAEKKLARESLEKLIQECDF